MASIIAAIRRSVAPTLEQYGFGYAGKPDSASWRFCRNKNGVDQHVDFVKSQHFDRAMRVDFSTSVEPISEQLCYLIPAPRPENDWWYYDDDKSLEELLTRLTNLAITYGLPYLESVSMPVQFPPRELTVAMLSDPEGQAQSFCRLAGIQGISAHELQQLDEFIRHAPQGEPITDWEPVLGATAFLGEVFRREFGGSWLWSEEYQTAIIGHIGRKLQEVFPLIFVCIFWSRRNERDSLRARFLALASM